jgi:carboxyl-terminal processing protease
MHKDQPNINNNRQFVIVWFLISTNLISGLFGYYYFNRFENLKNATFSSETRDEVWKIVKNNYINAIPDSKKLGQGELKGLIQALGDQNSAYLASEQEKRFQDQLNQRYVGVGIEFVEKNSEFIVNDLIANSPAQKAGVLTGDILFSVENKEVKGLSFSQIVNTIRGQENSSVKLVFIRNNEKKEFVLSRVAVEDKLVELKVENEFGIIEVKSFGELTDSQMSQIAKEIKNNQNITKLILDLRGDGGGLLDQGSDLASYFLPEKSIVFIEKDKNNNQVKNFSKLKNESLVDYPLVVLVDNGSASASEIVASSLRDNRDVKLVGTKTFGKGTIQKLFSLENGDTLKLTVAQWLTPKGEQIDKIGLEPDIIVGIEQNAIEVAKNIF